MVRNSLALVLVSACTINGKPFSPFGGAGGGTAAAAPSEPGAPTPSAPSTPSTSGGGDWGGAPTKAPVVEAVKSVPRCPNGKKYFLGAPEEYPGNGVESVVVADMNGDGKLDIVTGNPHGKRPPAPHFANVGVMMGKGDGTFADMAMYPVGSSSGGPTMSEPSLISAGDLNGDGKPELVFSSPTRGGAHPLYVPNNGDGTLDENISLGPDEGGDALIADFNGDGKNDIVLKNDIWLNGGKKGQAKFPAHAEWNSNYAHAEAAADLDGDGSLDLVASDTGRLLVYTNDGNASFTKSTEVAIERLGDLVRAGDFNGDGKPDVAVVAPGTTSVGVLINKGGAKLATPVYYKLPYGFDTVSWLLVSDLNSDGKADLVVADVYKGIAVLMNDGKGALGEPIHIGITKAYMVDAGDFDGKKVKSLVVVNNSEGGSSDVFVLHASCR